MSPAHALRCSPSPSPLVPDRTDHTSFHVVSVLRRDEVLVAMEKHTAFLEGAIETKKTPMCKENDLILSDMAGIDPSLTCRLLACQRHKERGLCKQWGLPGVGH